MTVLTDSEYEIPAPLVLQSLSVAREKQSGWHGALTESVMSVLNLAIVAKARPRLLADSADSMCSAN